MGNCGSLPKTKCDNDAVPAPEPAEEEAVVKEEVKPQIEEVKKDDANVEKQTDGGVNPADDNKVSSLGSLFSNKVFYIYNFFIIVLDRLRYIIYEQCFSHIYFFYIRCFLYFYFYLFIFIIHINLDILNIDIFFLLFQNVYIKVTIIDIL